MGGNDICDNTDILTFFHHYTACIWSFFCVSCFCRDFGKSVSRETYRQTAKAGTVSLPAYNNYGSRYVSLPDGFIYAHAVAGSNRDLELFHSALLEYYNGNVYRHASKSANIYTGKRNHSGLGTDCRCFTRAFLLYYRVSTTDYF